MNKNSLSQLNKLYVERCRQLTVQNQELQLKIDALEKAVLERNEIIEDMLSKVEKGCNESFEAANIPQETAAEVFDEQPKEQQSIAPETEPVAKSSQSVNEIPELPTLDSISEYAAKAISQMVISSAKHSNIITSSVYENKKDLLNLIIGKCENAKYEISDILQSECSDAQKAQMIDACAKDAIEYFGCVIEQK